MGPETMTLSSTSLTKAEFMEELQCRSVRIEDRVEQSSSMVVLEEEEDDDEEEEVKSTGRCATVNLKTLAKVSLTFW